MKQFEVGKSYRTFNNKTYTVTKRTEAFVTFTNASGTETFRRKPYEHSDGYEWTEGPNIGGYRISAVEEVKEQSAASVVVSMQPDVQPEEIAAPKADTPQTQKGRKTMTKLTTEQAVSTVQSATTAEEVRAVLEQCKKDQLHEVVLAVTGDKHWLSPKSRTKAELVHSYTWGIMRHKEDEEFKSKPFEKKYEALMDCSKYLQRIEYICLFSAEEVRAAAERLGLSYDCSHCSLANAVLRELRIRDKVQFMTECAKAKDVRLLKDALIDADFGGIAKEAFSRLIAQLGLAMDEATSKDTLKMGELLYRHYTESKELVAEATCNPDVQEASVIVDDIPADHEPDIQEASATNCEVTRKACERKVKERKELQAEFHKLWQKRHALRKAQRVFGEGSADAEALTDVWDQYQDQVDVLLGEYWRACEALSRSREKDSRYEASSQLADALATAETITHREPEVQSVHANKPKTTLSTKKKYTKASRKTHKPSWLKLVQLTSKPCKHSPAPKPLIKASRAASTLRIRKF